MDVALVGRLVARGADARRGGIGRAEVMDTWGPIAAVGWDEAPRGAPDVVARMGLVTGQSVTATEVGEAMGWSPVTAGIACARAGWRRWRSGGPGRRWLWEVT